MKIKNLKPSEILTNRDFPVHNTHILKIYFKICINGHKEILPPTPVVPLSVGLPLLKTKTKKAKEYNARIKKYVKENKNVKYFMCDGSHKTTALTLTHNKIHAVILKTDKDIREVQELVKTGDAFSMMIESTVKKELQDQADHLKKAKFFETIEDKTKRMVKEKVIPDYMIKFYEQ